MNSQVKAQLATNIEDANLDNEIYFPFDVSFVDCDTSASTRELVEKHLTKLARFYDRITDCKVAIRIPHKHQHTTSRIFHVHVQLDVPGKRLAVSREPELNREHSDISMALRDAFQKIIRQLEDFIRTRKEH